MKLSLNWLSEYVDLTCSADELVDRLTMAGLEVEGVEKQGELLEGIVTVKIDKIAPHPDADRLVVTQISDGTDSYQIVTGATNINEGDIVPVSFPGAVIASGMKLKEAKLRGIPSYGMMCSQKELGVSDEAAGIWILPADTPVGVDFVEYAQLKDTILDIAILPNRGDCMSIIGLARDIAAMLGQPLKTPKVSLKESKKTHDLKIRVSNNDKCPLYTARVIENLNQSVTPLWMQVRLFACGIRPISVLVDITNYVLLEYGQPLHAFDARKIRSEIDIRDAGEGEAVETLDGEMRALSASDLVISDGKTPVAIAGVMGAGNSEVDEHTSAVILEAAYFDPISVRRTSGRLALRSESSIRFEKGVDIGAVKTASDRAAMLMQELAGGEVASPMISVENKKVIDAMSRDISYDLDQINALLGAQFEPRDAEATLKTLGFELSGKRVSVPTWRCRDIEALPDLAEEIARLRGFDTIESRLSMSPIATEPDTKSRQIRRRLCEFLVANGMSEICTFPMISEEDCRHIGEDPATCDQLQNPITVEESVMRPSMLPSLLKVLSHNLNRQQKTLKCFEIGNVYTKSHGKRRQDTHLIVGVVGQRQSQTPIENDSSNQVDYPYIKGLFDSISQQLNVSNITFNPIDDSTMHPYQSAAIHRLDTLIGMVGFVHPELAKYYDISAPVAVLQLNLTALAKTKTKRRGIKPISKFPQTRRDIAFLANQTLTYAAIDEAIAKLKPAMVKDYYVFDAYEGESIGDGKKSMAIAFIYQDPERTLEDTEVNKKHDAFREKLASTLNVTLR